MFQQNPNYSTLQSKQSSGYNWCLFLNLYVTCKFFLLSVLQPCQIWGTNKILCIKIKSVTRRPNLRHGSQICGLAAKSVARLPNLWLTSQICGMAAKSQAPWPNLRHSGRIWGTAAKSELPWLNLRHSGWIFSIAAKSVHSGQICRSTAWRPYLRHSGHICGKPTKSVARQPNLWHGGQIHGTFKYILNVITKDVQIVYARTCTAQVISGRIYHFLSGLSQFFIIFMNRVG